MAKQMESFVDQLKSAVRGSAASPAGELPAEFVDAVLPWALACFVDDPERAGWREQDLAAGVAGQRHGLTSNDMQFAVDRMMAHLAVVALREHRPEWVGLMGLDESAEVTSPAE